MAQKTIITYVCDTCGKETPIEDGPGTNLVDMLEKNGLIEFDVKREAPKGRKAQTARVHYHRSKCLPGGFSVLVPEQFGASQSA